MGASVSTQQTTLGTDLYANATSKCETNSAYNLTNINNSTINIPEGCTLDVTQTATVDADCVLTNMISMLSSDLYNATNETKSELGIAVESSEINIQNTIQANVENECQGSSSTNIVNMSNDTITGCFVVDQTATEQTQCEINTIINSLNDYNINTDSTTTGGSLFGSIFGSTENFFIFIGALIALIIIAIIIIVVVKSMGKNKASKSTSTSMSSPVLDLTGKPVGPPPSYEETFGSSKMVGGCGSTITWLLIVAILILVFYLIYRQNKDKNIDNIKDIKHAREMTESDYDTILDTDRTTRANTQPRTRANALTGTQQNNGIVPYEKPYKSDKYQSLHLL